MMSAITLSVIMLSDILLNDIMLSGIMYGGTMLSVIMYGGIMVSVIIYLLVRNAGRQRSLGMIWYYHQLTIQGPIL
jgi:hypothetical protein